MSKYRIIEKKGTYDNKIKALGTTGAKYIPRFIVQETIYNPIKNIKANSIYKDLKEFTSLAEAEKYVEDILLEEGIVRKTYWREY